MKTSEMIGPALDWAVGKCWWHDEFDRKRLWIHNKTPFILNTISAIPPDKRYLYSQEWNPSTDWSKAGPIIEREKIQIGWWHNEWQAQNWQGKGSHTQCGPTPLIAAMRSYVASKLGDEVEIPEELK